MSSNSHAARAAFQDGEVEAQAVCLFAFVPAGMDMVVPPPPFPAASPVGLHRVGSIAALASFVPVSDYVGAEAQAKLADLEWLAPRTLGHAEVLRQAMLSATVFPMPFGTLFSSIEGMTAFMVAHEAPIARFLSRVSGKEEWGLKARAHLDRPETAEAMAKATWPDWASLTPGVRYLRVRRDHRSLVALARERAVVTVAALVAQLGPASAEIRELAPFGNAGDGGELISNYALLIPTSESSVRQACFDQLRMEAERQGIIISLSGPWPAFSFRPKLQAAEDEVDDEICFPAS